MFIKICLPIHAHLMLVILENVSDSRGVKSRLPPGVTDMVSLSLSAPGFNGVLKGRVEVQRHEIDDGLMGFQTVLKYRNSANRSHFCADVELLYMSLRLTPIALVPGPAPAPPALPPRGPNPPPGVPLELACSSTS